MNTSLHDGGSRRDFNRQQKTSKENVMTLISYFKLNNPEFLKQAVLTLAAPQLRPAPDAEISEFVAVYRDIQSDVSFLNTIKDLTAIEREQYARNQVAKPTVFPRLDVLGIRLGIAGAMDSTYDLFDIDQPSTNASDSDFKELARYIAETIESEGVDVNLVSIMQQAYDMLLTGNEEEGLNFVYDSLNPFFDTSISDEDANEEEPEDDEELEDGGESQGNEALEGVAAWSNEEEPEEVITAESVYSLLADVRGILEDRSETIGTVEYQGLPIDLDNLNFETISIYGEGVLLAIYEVVRAIYDDLVNEQEDEDEDDEDGAYADLSDDVEEDKVSDENIFDLDLHLGSVSQSTALGRVSTATPNINFALNVVVEANPMSFDQDMAEVKSVLSKCEFYTDAPLNFWNTLKASTNEKGARGFCHEGISNIIEYVNRMAETPVMVIADLSTEQVLKLIAGNVQEAVTSLMFSRSEVDLSDIAIPLVSDEGEIGLALDEIDAGVDVESASSDDFEEAGVPYTDINDLVYVSVYVADTDQTTPTIVVRVHINVPPIARATSLKGAITSISKSLAKLLDNSNVETTVGFAFNSVHVFENVDAGDAVRDLIDDSAYTLYTRSEIEDSVLAGESVLPSTLTPSSKELISGMFPYNSDWLALIDTTFSESDIDSE